MKPILVLGLGNPLQADDGIGCRVVQALAERNLPDAVEVLDGGTPGIGLVNLIEGRRRVVLVDAAALGQAPGEIRRLSAAELPAEPSPSLSLHTSGVGDALALMSALHLAAPDIVVYGVQPARIDWGEELSPPVQAAVPLVVQAVLREIGADHGD